jgi:hypothetical protein
MSMSVGRQLCFCVAFTASLILSGCARYKPKNYIPPNTFKSQYLKDVMASDLLKNYDDIQDQAKKVTQRNKILIELIALIDQNYSNFEDRYYGLDAKVYFGGDVVNLGLTGVSSVTGTAHLKSVLSAIATGTTGIKTSYEKNFFDQQTRSAIVQKMRAGRATQLAVLQDKDHMKAAAVCSNAGCSPYTLEAGLSDVEQYYEAGTIIGALQAFAQSAGAEQKSAADKQKVNSATNQLF